MIEFKMVSKRFGKIQALDKVDLRFESGQCIALIGPNGCGKTTLIKTLLGMVQPDEGSIFFREKPISGMFQYRSEIGYMPQIGRYPDNMQVGQVIQLLKTLRQEFHQPYDEELIQAFGLESRMKQRISTLSGGTRQKVSASLAFLFNPQVLILDEPTAGLDPVSSEILKDKILRERQNGKLIVITSHILSELDDMVTEVIYMEEGKPRFRKMLPDLYAETGEKRLSKALANLLQPKNPV